MGRHHSEGDHCDDEDGSLQASTKKDIIRHARVELPDDDYSSSRGNGRGLTGNPANDGELGGLPVIADYHVVHREICRVKVR